MGLHGDDARYGYCYSSEVEALLEFQSVHGQMFFFSSRRRHTTCGRDWSSDVCSSDLCRRRRCSCTNNACVDNSTGGTTGKIGRASCRERGEIQGVAGRLKMKRAWQYITDRRLKGDTIGPVVDSVDAGRRERTGWLLLD